MMFDKLKFKFKRYVVKKIMNDTVKAHQKQFRLGQKIDETYIDVSYLVDFHLLEMLCFLPNQYAKYYTKKDKYFVAYQDIIVCYGNVECNNPAETINCDFRKLPYYMNYIIIKILENNDIHLTNCISTNDMLDNPNIVNYLMQDMIRIDWNFNFMNKNYLIKNNK